jgi:3-deoxy-7-phosphoheptulonate synthase
MVILMRRDCLKKEVGEVMSAIRALGLNPRMISPAPKIAIGIVEELDRGMLEEIQTNLTSMSGVAGVETFGASWKLVSRDFMERATTIKVGPYTIGNGKPVVMAGPCAVESRKSIIEIAKAVKERGATFLRGGAFKPRSSPYSFRGLKEDGLKYMKEASELTGLPIITEVLTPDDAPLVAKYADILQIGARNMQNFALLEAVGDHDRPVFLKRGLMATIKELLLSAEYILARGNSQVMLCERGIRTFETATRNTLDISAVPLLKQLSHLPVMVDPSHAAGKRELVAPMALAAIAAGADGLMIEAHPEPEKALSDGRQSLDFNAFATMMKRVEQIAQVI